MEQPKGMHLISETTEGHISSQVLESMGMQKKVVPERELSHKIRCFACYDTSHSLDQCSIKYKLVPMVHQFGYATKFPFTMIQPLEHMLEKEIFYHHCVLITSNVSNLDLHTVKVELQKLWNLSCAWVLRRECSKSFLASFSSQGDVARCLNNPSTETLILNEEEVKLTVTRWTEDDDESNDLIQQWFLVCGVPRKYRAWMELYQVASAFGVLIDVDEGSLEVGDKEPIRLKIALSNQCGARFSYHYVVGWSSRMVMLTVEATIDSENNNHSTKIVTSTTSTHVLDFGDSSNKEHRKEQNAEQSLLLEEPTCIEESRLGGKTKENQISTPADKVHTSKKTTIKSSKAEGLQPVCRNSTTINREDGFKGIPKPPIEHVYKRKGKKQRNTDEAVNKSPSNKLDKGIGPENSKAKRIGALMGVSKTSEEVGASKEEGENSVVVATTPINSVEKKISEESSKTDKAQFKNSTIIMIGEDRFKGIPKPPVIHVYKRRGKKQKGIEAINKSPSETN
ncbi:unnamed protein product [Urochloa decumbens]|uniref:DUF4283 domain-containing protein n=1 Tax=Urochloa decumbens TaxID=240449 RepID=A0ABC9A100_9POAL